MASTLIITLGNPVTVAFTVEDDDGPISPEALTFRYQAPQGDAEEPPDEVVYVLGTDEELVEDTEGTFHVELPADVKGPWRWRWVSGDPGAADEGHFLVKSEYS